MGSQSRDIVLLPEVFHQLIKRIRSLEIRLRSDLADVILDLDGYVRSSHGSPFIRRNPVIIMQAIQRNPYVKIM